MVPVPGPPFQILTITEFGLHFLSRGISKIIAFKAHALEGVEAITEIAIALIRRAPLFEMYYKWNAGEEEYTCWASLFSSTSSTVTMRDDQIQNSVSRSY